MNKRILFFLLAFSCCTKSHENYRNYTGNCKGTVIAHTQYSADTLQSEINVSDGSSLTELKMNVMGNSTTANLIKDSFVIMPLNYNGFEGGHGHFNDDTMYVTYSSVEPGYSVLYFGKLIKQ